MADDTDIVTGIVTFSSHQYGLGVTLEYEHRADRITRGEVKRMIALLRSTANTIERDIQGGDEPAKGRVA